MSFVGKDKTNLADRAENRTGDGNFCGQSDLCPGPKQLSELPGSGFSQCRIQPEHFDQLCFE